MAKRQLNRRQNWRIEKIQGERAARAAKRESSAVEALEGGDLALGNHRRIAQAHDASVGDGGNTYTFNLSVDLDDIEQVKDLKEWIEAMRRKARANGGSF